MGFKPKLSPCSWPRALLLAAFAALPASSLAGQEEGESLPRPREKAARPAQKRVAAARANRGGIRGVVRNRDKNDELVAGADIRVAGTDLRTRSGPDGSYELTDVPAGSRTLEVSQEGLLTAKVPVEVKDGEIVDVPLAVGSDSGEVVMVIGRRKATLGAVLEKRRESAQQVTARDQGSIRTGAASTAAGVARELPSVTAVDNKYIYVRGLGDRYSQTLLNGSSIPSPEPDKRVIPLDLFPANLLDSIAIAKTYSPDIPGEFAGGSVQIKTIDVPEKPFLTLGFDARYRNGTTFRDFKTYHGGNLDAFSFDDGTRALPGEVPRGRVQEGVGGLTAEDLTAIGRSFTDIWNSDTTTAPLDHKVSLSFGETIGQKGSGALAILGALNWANKYQTISGEKRNIIINGGSRQAPKPEVFSDFTLDTSTFEAELSGLLNMTWEINDAQKVGVRTLYTRSSADDAREQLGHDGAQLDPLVRVNLLRYVSRSLFTVQPYGEHLLLGDTLLEWRAGYALSQRDEPDNRQVRYTLDPASRQFVFQFVAGSGRRDFYQLDENIYDAAIDYSIPFNPFQIPDQNLDIDKKAPDQKIKIGPAFVFRDRDFDARRFLMQTQGGTLPVDESGNPIDFTADAENIFRAGNINPRGLVLNEVTRPTDNYQAEQSIAAAYGLADFRLFRDLRFQGGARVENSVQKVKSFALFGSGNTITTKLETTDILPSGNLIWEFWKSEPPADRAPTQDAQTMLLRVGASQTVSRPEFRELAPFEYNDVLGGYTAVGNPDLKRAKILNADVAWEWYPSRSELISAGLFYKKFDSPIEVINLPTSGTLLTTWQNAQSADLYGFEIEGRKSLGNLAEELRLESLAGSLRDLSLISNFAYIKSEVRIQESATSLQTNNKRPLQGQPDYVLNLGMLYDSRDLGLTVSVMANTFGERISAVGAGGIDDEKEQPRWALDVSITKRLGKLGKSAIKLVGENLLDQAYEYKVGRITSREFKRGFAVGLSYSYSF